MQTIAALALMAALSHTPPAWITAQMFAVPPTPYAIFQHDKATGSLPDATKFELNETLREAGNWDIFR